ncbi:hypothetical protein EDD86DRAFT_173696, partial [Gorgonomyces haynaldii]
SWQTFSQAVPPERGAFPLDLDGKCKPIVKEYLECLQRDKNFAKDCRSISKRYLECRRMNNRLMEQDDFKNIGFS